MPLVHNTVHHPIDGTPAEGAKITVSLVAALVGVGAGYQGSTGRSIEGYSKTETDGLGLWSATLVANALLTPADTFYEVEERIPGHPPVRHDIDVPEAATTTLTGAHVLPAATITVASAASFEAASASAPRWANVGGQLVRYTGKGATTLTGATGGTGTVANGATVEQAYWLANILTDPPATLPTQHSTNPSGAHAASAVSATPAGSLVGATVAAQLAELDAEKQALIPANHFVLVTEGPLSFLDSRVGGNPNDTGDGTDNATAALAAMALLPSNGGHIVIPPGTYRGHLTFKDKPVRVTGAHGKAQPNSSGDKIRSATRIRAVNNAPIVTFTETDKTSIDGQHSELSHVGIIGTGAGASQTGLVVDNRGMTLRSVDAGQCGSHGIVVADCVGGLFEDVTSHANGGEGWRMDPSLGTGAACAVTNTVLLGCRATSNASHGFALRNGVAGIVGVGGNTESNGGWGLHMSSPAASFINRFNRWVGLWDELNTAGSWLVVADGLSTGNHIGYVRYSSGDPSIPAGTGNTFSGSDQLAVGNAQRHSEMMQAIRSAGGLGSSDLDALVVRNRTDDGDGAVRVASIILTYGLDMSDPAKLSVATPANDVPAQTDAICIPEGRGLSWRKPDNSGNSQILVQSGGIFYLGNGANAPPGGISIAYDGKVGFYSTTPIAKQTGVPVTAAGVHAALVALGLISA